MQITLKDGSILEVEQGISIFDLAGKLGTSLQKKTVGASVDGSLEDLRFILDKDSTLEILTSDDDNKDSLHILRHTASHIMAQAIKRIYKDVKLAIGPSIDDGFYYDIDLEHSLVPEDLVAIEAEMNKIIRENFSIDRFELPREEAVKFEEDSNEPYKVELIKDLPEGVKISFYKQGEFTDLCAGPHLKSTGGLKAFKLMSLAGAYWRGSEKNKMLQRIYGTAFFKKEDLDNYVNMLEEAKKRDHRKLGRELGIFIMREEGPGFPFFLPKGMIVRNILENFWREKHAEAGYYEIKTPIMLNEELWHRSGHWDHYKDNMYFSEIDEQGYCIKPMNCPGCILIYNEDLHSYRDLPLRMGELGIVHRHEKSGALHGLMRVRCFTQDDAHIFMTKDQIKDEILGVIKLDEYFYKLFGFKFKVELSTRPENSMGSDEDWEIATNSLKEALDESGLPYKINEGDGAFYGPKIDFHLSDCIGRTWQCGTIQLDYQFPEKFDLTYIGPDGTKLRPIMIHRTILGSIERFIGILIEHFAGAFPTWLAPVQVKVINITDNQAEYAKDTARILKEKGIRTEIDLRNEKIGYKIREARIQKIPYMIIVGDKEKEQNLIALRSRKSGDIGTLGLNEFISKITEEINEKSLDTL